MSQNKSSGGVRALEIILGLIAIAIGVIILIYPGLAIATIIFLLGIALLLVGLFRFFWGLVARNISGGARAAAILIGLIAIAVAAIVILYPSYAAITLVVFIAIAVLIYGVGRIAIGATAPQLGGGIRGLLVGTGLLMVIIGLLVLFYPGLGIAFLAVLLSIAFLFIGIESIAAGAVGARYVPQVPSGSTMTQ